MFLIALSPILWLVIALSVLHMPAHKACSAALVITIAAAMTMFGLDGKLAAEAALDGVALACWPILLVIIAAIFTYNLVVHTKGMEIIKAMLTSVSSDRRALILLIGWGFGGFLEGMAGFGTAIAIPAGMLAGIGIPPVMAVGVCLIANSVPTAYGSIGIPLVTLGSVTGIDATTLAGYTSLQLSPLTILCPFLMTLVSGGGLKGLKGMGIMCLAAGLAFLIPEYLIASTMGPELAVVAGSIGAMAAIVAVAKMFPVSNPEYEMHPEHSGDEEEVTGKKGLVAWLPFILIFVFLLLTSKLVPGIHDPLSAIKSSVLIYSGEGGTPYTFTWVNTPGILIFLAAFIGGSVQGAAMGDMLGVLKKTIVNLRFTIVTIITVIATAKVMDHSGMTLELAHTAVAVTGTMYPMVAAFIGSIGTFITGSATSSCVLFGKLQTGSAQAIGASESVQAWIAASNATGACAGKMISPQSIAIGVAAIGAKGIDGELLQFAVKVYIPFIIVMGCIVYFGQTFVG